MRAIPRRNAPVKKRPSWEARAEKLHQTFVNGKWEIGGDEDIRFLALSLCGEAGELANWIKKKWRGDKDIPMSEIHKELADINIFLNCIAKFLNCDLDKACEEKIIEVEGRLESRKKKEK